MMGEKEYPENRLNIRIDSNGQISYERNPVFEKYYAVTREEKETEIEELRERLELLEIDEPDDLYSHEHDEWEEERNRLEDEIIALEEEIDSL